MLTGGWVSWYWEAAQWWHHRQRTSGHAYLMYVQLKEKEIIIMKTKQNTLKLYMILKVGLDDL